MNVAEWKVFKIVRASADDVVFYIWWQVTYQVIEPGLGQFEPDRTLVHDLE